MDFPTPRKGAKAPVRFSRKRKLYLQQLYNRANVLYNLEWEAKYALEKEMLKEVVKCKTKEEFEALRTKFSDLFHCDLWEAPKNPKPNRPNSHSGDLSEDASFSIWHFAASKEWIK